jgi:peptidoglycan/xylan/chitin deacetylase (PgdA/CDA1 family)
MKRVLALAASLLAPISMTAMSEPRPEIAITIDDLPVHAPYPPGVTPTQVNEQMIASIKAGGIPVIGFVNGIGTVQHPETLQVLPKWRAAGLLLGNHTWSHPHLSQLTIPQFEAEVMKGDPMLARLGRSSDWRWFRYPFLDEGKDESQRTAARQVLRKHGYRVADVTTSFSDWAFTPAWARCNAAGDKAAIAELERMYLDAAKESISVARGTAHTLYGRDIPYVLLMHISAMSAHMMPQVIKMYRAAGFRFVTIQQAESDPVYRPDVDLSLPGRVPDWKLAKDKGVKLPETTDLTAKLDAMCPAPNG